MCSIDKNEQDSCALERSLLPGLMVVELVRPIYLTDDGLRNIQRPIFFACHFKTDESVKYYEVIAWQECQALSGKFDDKASIALSAASIVIYLISCFVCMAGFVKLPGFDSRDRIPFTACNRFVAVCCHSVPSTVENAPG